VDHEQEDERPDRRRERVGPDDRDEIEPLSGVDFVDEEGNVQGEGDDADNDEGGKEQRDEDAPV